MKREFIVPSKKKLYFYRAGIILLLLIAVVLAAGSLFALFRPPNAEPLIRIGSAADDAAVQGINTVQNSGTTEIFSGLGRIRIPLSGENPGSAVLSVSFPYPAGDIAFSEELASRIGSFRSIITAYFSSLTGDEVQTLDENKAKTEILKQFNALLLLGRIESIYFTDLRVFN
ncbi:MAG: flagellar basal body-associated FliL family protein [Treponema sp.]|nr:flagellar basal body-associated FliL family protein [Treponema sp.]